MRRDASRRSLVLLCVLALAACSSGGASPSPSERSRTPSETTGSPPPSASVPPPVMTTKRFQTPSENIVCESFASSFLCVIKSGLVPEPSHDFCPVDWIGVFIETDKYAGPSCSGDPGISRDRAEELPYGHTWTLSGVTCLSANTGLSCHDSGGNGFTLARAGWSLLGKRGAATAAFPALRTMVSAQVHNDLPGQVANVPAPVLRGGHDCGELQQAFVQAELKQGGVAVYSACYVTGTWFITAGPQFPD